MKLTIEVQSNNSNTTNYIRASLNRHKQSSEYLKENLTEVCNEVAKELRLHFELKQDGNLLFCDRDLQ